MGRRWPWPARKGAFQASFTAASADVGYSFDVRAEGLWHRTTRHHDPAAAVTCHVIDDVARLAAACPILAPTELEHRANSSLGRPTGHSSTGVQLLWATVHVHVAPDDLYDAKIRIRARALARTALQEQQERITQLVGLRDLLREDPTLVLAQILLENPSAINQQTVTTIEDIARQVAAHAPGATWVKTADLLQKSFGGMAEDEKQFLVDRLCIALNEIGHRQAAKRLQEAHRFTNTQPPTLGDGCLPAAEGPAPTSWTSAR